MKHNEEYNLVITGKVGRILDEVIKITGDDPAKLIESLIVKYHKEVISNLQASGSGDDYPHLKIGKIANIHLRKLLYSRKITDELLVSLQTEEYSKVHFDLQYPLLVRQGTVFESVRYYKKPLTINGDNFFMCSQWFETVTNDDRSYLLFWMKQFQVGGSNE